MKSLFAVALGLLALPVCAQQTTSTAASVPSTPAVPKIPDQAWKMPMFATLSDGDKTQLGNAYTKAMLSNPDLWKEEEDMRQQGIGMRGKHFSDDDRKKMFADAKAHFDKVRAAIIAADPTIEPVLMRIDQQMAKMKADWEAAHPSAGPQ